MNLTKLKQIQLTHILIVLFSSVITAVVVLLPNLLNQERIFGTQFFLLEFNSTLIPVSLLEKLIVISIVIFNFWCFFLFYKTFVQSIFYALILTVLSILNPIFLFILKNQSIEFILMTGLTLIFYIQTFELIKNKFTEKDLLITLLFFIIPSLINPLFLVLWSCLLLIKLSLVVISSRSLVGLKSLELQIAYFIGFFGFILKIFVLPQLVQVNQELVFSSDWLTFAIIILTALVYILLIRFHKKNDFLHFEVLTILLVAFGSQILNFGPDFKIFYIFSLIASSLIIYRFIEVIKQKTLSFIFVFIIILIFFTIHTNFNGFIYKNGELPDSLKVVGNLTENDKILAFGYSSLIDAEWLGMQIVNPVTELNSPAITASLNIESECSISFTSEVDSLNYESCFKLDDNPLIFRNVLVNLEVNYIFIATKIYEDSSLLSSEFFPVRFEDDYFTLLAVN